ncbi:hypothetical protein KIN20_007728, partial [Parelaphostrongylus tenuis]
NSHLTFKRDFDREAFIEANEDGPTLTIKKLADDFDHGHATISRVLKAAGNKWKTVRWIHNTQTRERKDIAQQLLCRHSRLPILAKVIIVDEKWISD